MKERVSLQKLRLALVCLEACTRVLLQLRPVEPRAGAGATTSPAVQTNGTQPLSKTWEHSLYELERTPQEAITDGLEIQLEAGPSNKHTKTSDDSGLELDNSNAKVASDPVMDMLVKLN
ncbi:hypothetical protein Celaphus_00012853 [Cervus elaphus hippelaphus]|uniref:Uncharacterized protein n=1 Tax=Cervus elaphus hippelaphus TaxID=46360 RepID=A0A212CIT6_CEREH|nr:hypothetical protein Celaphus_00012853 [Cervus elaphus hippelaphus]